MSDELTPEEVEAAWHNTGVSNPALHLPVPPRRWWRAFQPMIATRLAAARNDALEEAKRVAIRRRKEAMKSAHPDSVIREDEAEEIAVAIEALKGSKP